MRRALLLPLLLLAAPVAAETDAENAADPFERLTPYIAKWRGGLDCSDGASGTHSITVKRSKKRPRLIVLLKGRSTPGQKRKAGMGKLLFARITVAPGEKEGVFRWWFNLPSTNPIVKLLGRRKVRGILRVSKGGRRAVAETTMDSLDNLFKVTDRVALSKTGKSFTHDFIERIMTKQTRCKGRSRRLRRKKKAE